MQEAGIKEVEFSPRLLSYLSPGESVLMKKDDWRIGWLGKLHPEICETLELPMQTYLFELDLNSIVSLGEEERRYSPLPRFPSVKRDLSIVIREEISAAEVKQCVLTQGKWIEEVEFFDLYRGGNILPGHKSLTFSITFRHPYKTLTDNEVNVIQEKILGALKKKWGASLRTR